jgi:hypothetical protein
MNWIGTFLISLPFLAIGAMFLLGYIITLTEPDTSPKPFTFPLSVRFEHTHIVAGSGHGKTQLLQKLILEDLKEIQQGKRTAIIMDSQGDLIRNILWLAELEKLKERFVFINGNDLKFPPALNLFDFGLDRVKHYDELKREQILNGAVSLYEYLFGGLLKSEMTGRQTAVFRYLARLMMVVPGGTMETLMNFMKDPDSVKPYLAKLDPNSVDFFKSHFFSPMFDSTRQQNLTRLYTVRSISALDKMLSSPKNKLDIFTAMNRGSLILVDTAKALLQEEGCEIFGRFIIALIAQATNERAAIEMGKRTPTFIYIDEAQDYFDDNIKHILSQGRKYQVGLTFAHQNLDQLGSKLRAAVMSNTAIKYAGGLSDDDATRLAKEMQCSPDYILKSKKLSTETQFAAYARNHTSQATTVTVPFRMLA